MKTVENLNASLRKQFLQHIKITRRGTFTPQPPARQASLTLKNSHEVKKTGSYFTSHSLAINALSHLPSKITRKSIVFDPTCGTGDLLLAASDFLPVNVSLDKTINCWSKVLRGFDLHESFVECTKLRLIERAILRGARVATKNLYFLEHQFTHIQCGNIFENLETISNASHIITNPPYTQVKLERARTWGKGRQNIAGVIFEDTLLAATPGSNYVAILPDVFRSGTRHERWRQEVLNTLSKNTRISIAGRFDKTTDVDVVLISGQVNNHRSQKHKKPKPSTSTISVGDLFDVSVGPLVAYRDKLAGNIAPYICAKSVEWWKEINCQSTRRTKSRLITPPFVVIGRTSSPTDNSRAKASIIRGDQPIAVENHLLVLRPKKNGLHECRKLVKLLKHDSTNRFMNTRIRCRHLTVLSVKEIPWQDNL